MNQVVYKIDNELDYKSNIISESNILSELNINEFFPIQDTTTNNKMIVNRLCVGNDTKKMYIETSLLEVMFVSNNKLHLRLPKSHIDFFNLIDDKCTELLSDLVNGETELDISKLCGKINSIGNDGIENFDFTNIEYKSIVSNDLETNEENILKINIFSNTTIKHGNKFVDISKIKVGDSVRLVLGLDYISLLIDATNLVARTKLYCYLIDISKKYIYNPEPREKILNWEFLSNNKNVFIKTNTTDEDNFNVESEICQNLDTKTNNITKPNTLSPIIEFSDTINFNDDTSLIGESLKDIKSIVPTNNIYCGDDKDDDNEISESENIKLLSSVINKDEKNIYIDDEDLKNTNKTQKKKKTKTSEKKIYLNKKSTSKNKINVETNKTNETNEINEINVETNKTNETNEINEINEDNNKIIKIDKSDKNTKPTRNKKSQSKMEKENDIKKETKTLKKNTQKK